MDWNFSGEYQNRVYFGSDWGKNGNAVQKTLLMESSNPLFQNWVGATTTNSPSEPE